jgi:4-aminobutyrate aminotransferase-like enzyme
VTAYDAIEGLERRFKTEVDPESVACVVLEPVQGEGGFIPMTADFPARLHEICTHHGILFVDDEVQSGIGTCGNYGNVIRILVPLVISDEDADRGLEILEESLGDAGTGP